MANLGITQKNITNFNGGELSPLLYGRTDLDIWSRGCRQLQNMLPRKYGNADRRVGTRFVAETKYPSKHSINIAFDLSSTVSLNIEMGDYYFRFDRLGSPVMNGNVPYEIAHPYPESALDSVMFTQINDVMYVTHPDYPPYKLSHFADNNWTMVPVQFDEPVFKDMNITTTKITPSGTTGTITLTSSSSLFNAAQVGGYYKLGQVRAANRVELPLTVTGTSAELDLKGDFTVRTSGTWAGTLEVQRYDTTTSEWSTIYTHISDKDRNVEASYKQDGVSARWRMVFTFISKDSTNPTAYLESAEDYVYGWAKITAFTSPTSVTATVEDAFLNTTATATWYEGAWSPYRGYPAACALFQQRMVYSGTYHQPQTIWGSVSGDYQNFEYGTDDDMAFQYTIGSSERLSTQWLCVHNNALIIGTSTGNWAMSGSNGGDDPVTPTNVIIRRQTTTGDAKIRPIVVDNAILHVQRNREKLYEMTYSIQSYKYDDSDITQFSEHITKGGIVSIAYARQPDGIIFCVRSDGVLLACVYDSSQKVIAWSRIVTQGFVESVAVIYGPVGDEVWLIVNRNVNGTWKRLKERLYPVLWDSKIDCWYLDCGYLAWNGGGGGGGGGGNGGYEPGNVVALEAAKQYALDIGYGKIHDFNPTNCIHFIAHDLFCSYGSFVESTTPTWPMYVSQDGINWNVAACSSELNHSPEILGIVETNIPGYKYVCAACRVDGDVLGSDDSKRVVIFYSNNALLWHRLSGTNFSFGRRDALKYSSSLDKLFIICVDESDQHEKILYTSDLVSWIAITDGSGNFPTWSGYTNAIVCDDTQFKIAWPSLDSNPKLCYINDSLSYVVSDNTFPNGGWNSRNLYIGSARIVSQTTGGTYLSSDMGLTWTYLSANDGFEWFGKNNSYNSHSGNFLSQSNEFFPTLGNDKIYLFSHESFSNPVEKSEGIVSCIQRGYDNMTCSACPYPNSDSFLVLTYNTFDNSCHSIPVGTIFSDAIDRLQHGNFDIINSKVKHGLLTDQTIVIKSTGTVLDNNEFHVTVLSDYSFKIDNTTLHDNIGSGIFIKKVHEITGLDELAGSTVDANCDGDPVMDLTVDSSGTITLPGYYDQVIIGLRYDSIFEPMGTDASSESGYATGQTRRYRKALVRLKDTLGMSYTTDYATYNKIVSVGTANDAGDIVYTDAVFRNSSDVISESPELFTGLFEINLDSHHSRDPRLVLKQSAPMPFNCLGATFKYEITEPSSGKAQQ